MNQGLFESLTGQYRDKHPVDAIPAGNRMAISIIDHLARMFNCRQGQLFHEQEYGSIARSTENNSQETDKEISREIKKIIENFEPRLRCVKVLQGTNAVFVVNAEILSGQHLQFNITMFEDHAKITLLKS